MYQTKTIAGILGPVAQQVRGKTKSPNKFSPQLQNFSSQVSKLIILHEEGEDGNAMPDLERPVTAVSKAVDNLARVGRDTADSSQASTNIFQKKKTK